jgi:hypothetical protein
LLDDLTLFLDIIANGSMSADYYDFLAESRLVAISKSEDSRDIRPIALAELVGNMLTRMLSAKIKEILGPVQLGCGFHCAL